MLGVEKSPKLTILPILSSIQPYTYSTFVSGGWTNLGGGGAWKYNEINSYGLLHW